MTSVIGSSRRAASTASLARVTSFSRASSRVRAARHSSGDTICGVSISSVLPEVVVHHLHGWAAPESTTRGTISPRGKRQARSGADVTRPGRSGFGEGEIYGLRGSQGGTVVVFGFEAAGAERGAG